jgi:hypothetical protein
MAKTRQTRNAPTRLTGCFLTLAHAAVRTLNALAADRALAQRAATMAAQPRERLAELRGLYTTHEPVLASVRVDKAALSAAVESSEFLSAYEEKRAA